jgi:SNF2 family DNA or RNA helicase
MEPMLNAADEAQALSRVHRFGQPVKVRCVCFYAKNGVEERVLLMRQEARALTEMHSGKSDASIVKASNKTIGLDESNMRRLFVGANYHVSIEDIQRRERERLAQEWRPDLIEH